MFLQSFNLPVTSVVLIKFSTNNGSPFKDYLQPHSFNFLNVRMSLTYFFCQPNCSLKTSTYLSFISTYIHLSHPKTLKVKLPCQIKSSGNQPNPTVLKNWKTKELSTKYKIFPKLISIVIAKIKSNNEKQFRTHYPVHRKWHLQTLFV